MSPFSLHILLYHDVAADAAEAALRASPRFTTTIGRLNDHVKEIRKADLKATRIEELLQWRRNNRFPEGRHALITFDGPHVGWFKHAIPLLESHAMPATFFITAGWVGEKHRYPESRHLSWADVASIRNTRDRRGEPLFDIGSHSMWHSVLQRQKSETKSAYHARLHEEIVSASRRIESELGARPVSYATPKGEGKSDDLKPHFHEAGIKAVRWARLPGEALAAKHDPFDLQIAYCDIAEFGLDDFRAALALEPV